MKEVLGEHANQAGSLVAPGHLRFDFTHFGQITSDELAEMERIVNEKIWEAIPVETIETDIDTAKNMGAMAIAPIFLAVSISVSIVSTGIASQIFSLTILSISANSSEVI